MFDFSKMFLCSFGKDTCDCYDSPDFTGCDVTES